MTEREIEVLRLVVKEYSTQEIAELFHVSVSTVDTYRKSLIKKIKVKN